MKSYLNRQMLIANLESIKASARAGPNHPFIYTNKATDQRHSVQMPISIL